MLQVLTFYNLPVFFCMLRLSAGHLQQIPAGHFRPNLLVLTIKDKSNHWKPILPWLFIENSYSIYMLYCKYIYATLQIYSSKKHCQLKFIHMNVGTNQHFCINLAVPCLSLEFNCQKIHSNITKLRKICMHHCKLLVSTVKTLRSMDCLLTHWPLADVQNRKKIYFQILIFTSELVDITKELVCIGCQGFPVNIGSGYGLASSGNKP